MWYGEHRKCPLLIRYLPKSPVFPFPPLPPPTTHREGREKGKEKLDFLPLDN